MSEFNILTINTPVVYATMRNESIALIKGKPLIYHKEFDITEFIGEALAGIREVRCVHYFPVCFGNYKRCLGDAKQGFDRGNIRVGSFDFKRKGIKYIHSFEMFSRYPFDGLDGLMRDVNNPEEVCVEHLEMEALDIYMGQKDRKGNIYYEYHPNGDVHLAPMFDFENSLFELLKSEITYQDDFSELKSFDDYRRRIEKYPYLGECLMSYQDVVLEDVIRTMASSRGFDLSKFDMGPYSRFDEVTHKKLELILK